MGELLRKIFIVPVILAGLAIVFIGLSLLLLVWKGNARVLGAKLRVGALIIALQAIGVQGAWTAGSCYERSSSPPQRTSISLKTAESGEIHLNLKEATEIRATLHDAYGPFSFQVARKSSQKWETVQSGELTAIDGSPNNPYGPDDKIVAMRIDPMRVRPGIYELRILQGDSRSSAYSTPFFTIRLIVVNE